MKGTNILIIILITIISFVIMFIGASLTELLIDIIDDMGASDTNLMILKTSCFILIIYILIRQAIFLLKYLKEELK